MYILVFNEIFGLFLYSKYRDRFLFFGRLLCRGVLIMLLEMIVVILDVRILLLFVLKVEIGLINIDL